MKRFFRSLMLCVLFTGFGFGFLFAQDKPADNFSCTAPAVSHWSLGLKGGAALQSGLDAGFGGSLDYSINPFIGLGLEGIYLNNTGSVLALGYGSLNLLNLCSTYRSGFWQRINLFLVAGAGARLNTATTDPIVLIGLNAEYNFSKAFALELGTEGIVGGGSTMLATLGLRYKFTSSHRQHARNIAMCDYIPKPATIVISETKGKDSSDALNARLKAAEASQQALLLKAQKLAEELDVLQSKK
jgi:hypothetical protein